MTDPPIDLAEGLETANRLVGAALTQVSGGLGLVTAYLAQSAGKGFRAKVLLSAALDAEGRVPADAARAAAAVELLHMATLAHDDVLDDAPTRRGIPAVHLQFDVKSAVLCGDYLLCASLSMLTGIETAGRESAAVHTARFSRALAGVCKGEYNQHLNSGNLDLDVPAYLKIIHGKTAALFYAAASTGGLLGGGDENAVRALGRYGRCLGMVFQVADDCKDYEMSEAEAKKPVGNDIRSKVVTLPLILAMRKEPPLRALARRVMDTGQDIPLFLEKVRRAGGPDQARQAARRYAQWAARALEALPGVKKKNLMEILHKVI